MASPLFLMCVLLVILFCFHSYSCENFQSESSYRLSDSDLRKKFDQPLQEITLNKNGNTLIAKTTTAQPLPVYLDENNNIASPNYTQTYDEVALIRS